MKGLASGDYSNGAENLSAKRTEFEEAADAANDLRPRFLEAPVIETPTLVEKVKEKMKQIIVGEETIPINSQVPKADGDKKSSDSQIATELPPKKSVHEKFEVKLVPADTVVE